MGGCMSCGDAGRSSRTESSSSSSSESPRHVEDPIRRQAGSSREQSPSNSSSDSDKENRSSETKQSPEEQDYPTLDFEREETSSSSEETSNSDSDHDKTRKSCESQKNLRAFKRTYKTKISKHKSHEGVFLAESESKTGTEIYQNVISINEGQVRGRGNFKNNESSWYFSDIIHFQIQLVMKKAGKDASEFNLRSWYGEKIIDQKTKSIINHFLPQDKLSEIFEEGSDGFEAFKQLPTAK